MSQAMQERGDLARFTRAGALADVACTSSARARKFMIVRLSGVANGAGSFCAWTAIGCDVSESAAAWIENGYVCDSDSGGSTYLLSARPAQCGVRAAQYHQLLG